MPPTIRPPTSATPSSSPSVPPYPHLTLVIFTLAVFAAAYLVFCTVLSADIPTDIQSHLRHVAAAARGDLDWPVNALYFWSVYAVSGFSSDPEALGTASAIVLALSVAVKAAITLGMIRAINSRVSIGHAVILAACLQLAFSLPGPGLVVAGNYYLGQIPPTVWHNSTTIFLVPFALALFWVQWQDLEAENARLRPWIYGLVALNILAKPSFFLAFAPTVLVLHLVRYGIRLETVRRLGPTFFGLALIGVQFALVYRYQHGTIDSADSATAIGFLDVWSLFVPKTLVPLAIVTSLLFPITFFAVKRGTIRRTGPIFAILLVGVSLLIFMFLKETGPRFAHGNFFWQSVVASYVLFVMAAAEFSKCLRGGGWSWRETLIAAVFGLHLISGGVYLARIFLTHNYN